jgi:hypothetical protein
MDVYLHNSTYLGRKVATRSGCFTNGFTPRLRSVGVGRISNETRSMEDFILCTSVTTTSSSTIETLQDNEIQVGLLAMQVVETAPPFKLVVFSVSKLFPCLPR